MKRKTAISLASIVVILVLIVSHFVAWSVGYIRGHIRMGKLKSKTALTINMRAYDALKSNDLERVQELVEFEIWSSSLSLSSLIADPNDYFIQTLDWHVASDEAYGPKLKEAETIRSDMQSRYKEISDEDGKIHYLPPSLTNR